MLLALAGLSLGASPRALSTSYTTVVDVHVSELMHLFYAHELNHEWNPRLKMQRTVQTRQYGQLVYQRYELPWPLHARDMLMACDRRTDQRAEKFFSGCRSVRHPDVPVYDNVVRVELQSTSWAIRALPNDKTEIRLDLTLPAETAAGVPAFVVRYCQRSMLRDSVNAFLGANKRLGLPAHDDYTHWARTRNHPARRRRSGRLDAAAAHAPLAAARYLARSHDGVLALMIIAAVVFALLNGAVLGLVFIAATRRDRRAPAAAFFASAVPRALLALASSVGALVASTCHALARRHRHARLLHAAACAGVVQKIKSGANLELLAANRRRARGVAVYGPCGHA